MMSRNSIHNFNALHVAQLDAKRVCHNMDVYARIEWTFIALITKVSQENSDGISLQFDIGEGSLVPEEYVRYGYTCTVYRHGLITVKKIFV